MNGNKNNSSCILIGGVLTIILVVAVCFLASFLFIGGSMFVVSSVADQIEGQGETPPNFATAKESFPLIIGEYHLDEESLRPIDEFYGLIVDDAYTGRYEGPDGVADLTLIQTDSPGEAAKYISEGATPFIDNLSTASRTSVSMPSWATLIYTTDERAGKIWNSQNWLIEIRASEQPTRDTFFEGLPYR